jgi:DnaK suppressor protein
MALKKKTTKAPVKKATMAKPTKKAAPKAPAKKVAAKPAKKVAAKAKPVKVPAKSVKVAPKPLAKPAAKPPVKAAAKPVKSPVKPVAKAPVKSPVPKALAPKAVKAPVVKVPVAKPVSAKAAKPKEMRHSVVGPLEIAPYQPEVNEEYMGAEQMRHFRLILNQWKDQLMQEVDSTVGHMKEEAILYPDPLDRAAQEEGFNLELRTRDRERRLIKKIEMSLDKIDNGEYGYCQSCGTEIGLRRLEARPTADKCIDCKTFEEIREKQSGL